MLFGAASLFLLIACTILAGLFFLRAAERQREVAVRLALGAGPKRLLVRFTVEGALIGILGLAAGMVMAWAGLQTVQSIYSDFLPPMTRLRMDRQVVLFVILLLTPAVLTLGLLPLRRALRVDVAGSLRTRTATDPLHARYRESRSDIVVIVRHAESVPELPPMIRSEVRAFDPEIVVYGVTELEQAVDSSLDKPRSSGLLLTMFGGLALVLTAVGLYGSLAYSFRQRRFEIAVRMALGARRKDVMGLAMRQGILPALSGLLLGLGGCYWAARYLAAQLYGVTAFDVWTYGLALAFIAATAGIAGFPPARRAAREDPAGTLRAY